MEEANNIINEAIQALRAEAQAIEAKIATLEGSLSIARNATASAAPKAPTAPRRGRPKKVQVAAEPPPAPKKAARSKAKATPAAKTKATPATKKVATKTKSTKDTIQTAAEKRSKSWDAAKKSAAAERMRKYWAQRKKQG